MLGGDKFKNNLGNQMIIKCHKCGDTDLRYVGFPRTDGHPSGYVCGQGHETWGAVDEYIEEERWGQTDQQLQRVGDCCCESLGCDLPDSINVEFEGILGVQAKESCSHNIFEDVRTRTYMPLSMCGPCCSGYYTYGENGSWWMSCGCDKAQGPCTFSDDSAATKSPQCISYSEQIFGTGVFCTGVSIINYDSVTFYDNIPANRADAIAGWRAIDDGPWMGLGQQCSFNLPINCCASGLQYPNLSGPFFAGGYPEAFEGSIGPSFITEGPSTVGNIWYNDAMSVKFLVREQIQVKWSDPCNHGDCCIRGKRTYYIVTRSHPTTDPTGNSGFTWTISQEGIADPVLNSIPCDSNNIGCAVEWESPDIDLNSLVADFCNLDNASVHCTNCNNSIGEMSAVLCNDDDDGSRRFWPFRVPYFKDINDEFQYVRENQSKYPTFGECNCGNADYAISVCQDPPPGPDDPQVPDYCTKNIVYPNCLAQGTDKCYDVDSRYRIACSNPGDYFTGSLVGEGNKDLLDYRYSIDYNSFNGAISTKDIENIVINFNPIWEGRRTSTYDSGGEVWSFPKSTNPLCVGADRIGYVTGYGHPKQNREGNNLPWDSELHPEFPRGAIGITTAKLGEVFEDSKDIIQQPHCLRRVENPNLRNKGPFYQVNTADVSNQTIILDRYYKTSNDFDWLWQDYPLAEPSYPSAQPFINRQGDRGVTDLLNSQLFPYPFISRSGSIEEPEIVAIIHSEKGKGGQVAFQTVPVSYDTDTFIDPTSQLKPVDNSCPYKTRVTAYGYGVMYPLIDDPLWSEEIDTTEWWDIPYDPNNPIFDTTRQRKSTFEYPVFIPGTGYEIGDKIEFRCWKCLDTEEKESVWEEECVESIIATATITELNDERIAPSITSGIADLRIVVDIQPSGTDRYRETWKVNRVSITGGTGYSIDDVIPIRFSDTNGLNKEVYYDVYPSAIVTETGVSGIIVDTDIIESGSFYKIIRTGGIRWYEFDEVDDNGDYLISVGNCPCSFDICGPDCNGCVSKEMYPSEHEKLDAAPNGFPGTPYGSCLTVDGITKTINNEEVPVQLYCPSSSTTVNCGTSTTFTGRWTSVGGLGWINLNANRCPDNCGPETFPSSSPSSYGDTESVNCVCYKPDSGGVVYIGDWSSINEYDKCWPVNKSYEFEGKEENYARAACSGDPVIAGQRAYMDGHYVMPHKKPQYKYQWLPNVSGFLAGVGRYVDSETADNAQAMNGLKDAFLSIDACNPGKYDRFNKSYRWLTKNNSGKPPCRKKLNNDDNIPSGVGVDTPRTIDDYCRAYGFYQQRQPTCEVVYRGQYIMRAAVKAGLLAAGIYAYGDCDDDILPNETNIATDCEPIIEDINIFLNKFEAQIDISVGAPYNQDYLIPEQLPIPYTGEDGFLESRADSWGYPSLVASGVERYFDHGFYEPNRYGQMIEVIMPENQQDLGIGEEPIKSEVLAVNPLFHVYDVEGGGMWLKDQRQGYSFANINVWDWPDPRSNCSGTCDQYDVPLDVLYPSGNVPLPSSLIENDLSFEHLYPWENVRATDNVDHYAMFKNNSAELVVGEIQECENCRGSFLINNRLTPDATAIPGGFVYGDIINYTDIRMYHEETNGGVYQNEITRHYIMFRAFGKNNNDFTQQAFKDVIDDYIQAWTDRMGEDLDIDLYSMFTLDIHRSVLFNMLFNGAANDKLEGLTKVEIFYLQTLEKPPTSSSDPIGEQLVAFTKLYTEDRCEYYQKTGTIKSVNVLNGGSGYAFELEERVAPTGFVQSIPELHISGSTRVSHNYRRREEYSLESVSLSGIGTSGHYVGESFDIKFNDKDAVRKGITILQQPSIVVTEVDASGYITDHEILNSGIFYKYIKTGQHRAFPTAIVLNNYWDYPNGQQNFGRHAKLVPIIGVDPKDPSSYGKIKRVEVAFGGIEYVQPGIYWGITTTMGDYDNYGNIGKGLDIQHLVDPCKYNIHGEGITSQQVIEYKNWLGNPENYQSGTMFFPEELSYWSPESDPTLTQGDPFTKSIKYYYNTNSGMNPTKWVDKVKGWETVIISGSCPVDASGGLLNRTYSMALVEEATMSNSHPYIGNCSKSQCDQLIDYSQVDLDNNPSVVYPEEPRPHHYGDPCPVFTVYDAHRFPVAGTNNLARYITATPPPYLWGCDERIDIEGYPDAQALFCYNTYNTTSEGGKLQTQGHIRWPILSSSKDLCSNVDYSLYAEFGKWTNNGNQRNRPIMRSKAITYGMGGTPITMKVSYNDDSVPVAYSGCEDPIMSGICECPPTPPPSVSISVTPNPTPTPTPA